MISVLWEVLPIFELLSDADHYGKFSGGTILLVCYNLKEYPIVMFLL
jgi:hypothetical protein